MLRQASYPGNVQCFRALSTVSKRNESWTRQPSLPAARRARQVSVSSPIARRTWHRLPSYHAEARDDRIDRGGR